MESDGDWDSSFLGGECLMETGVIPSWEVSAWKVTKTGIVLSWELNEVGAVPSLEATETGLVPSQVMS